MDHTPFRLPLAFVSFSLALYSTDCASSLLSCALQSPLCAAVFHCVRFVFLPFLYIACCVSMSVYDLSSLLVHYLLCFSVYDLSSLLVHYLLCFSVYDLSSLLSSRAR